MVHWIWILAASVIAGSLGLVFGAMLGAHGHERDWEAENREQMEALAKAQLPLLEVPE